MHFVGISWHWRQNDWQGRPGRFKIAAWSARRSIELQQRPRCTAAGAWHRQPHTPIMVHSKMNSFNPTVTRLCLAPPQKYSLQILLLNATILRRNHIYGNIYSECIKWGNTQNRRTHQLIHLDVQVIRCKNNACRTLQSGSMLYSRKREQRCCM